MSRLRNSISRFVLSSFTIHAALAGCIVLAGCGGGGGNGGGGGGSSPTITSVTTNCAPSSIQTGQTSQCTATVTGTGSYSSGVTWSVSPSSIGSVNTAGVFTPTVSGTATITATSAQDATKSGASTVKAEPMLLSVQPNTVVAGSTVSISATGVDTQNLNNNVVSFTQTGRVFTANPSAAAPQGANTVLTVPLPSGISPLSASASFAVPTTVSLSTNGVAAQSTMPIQVQPPAHAVGISPGSAALSTSVPVSFSAVFTAFSSVSSISSDDPGLTATNISVVSPTLITARVNVAAGTAVGNHLLTISSGGSPITFDFTVVAAPVSAPVVTNLSSAQLAPGAPLTISGSGFLSSSSSPQAVIQYTYGGVAANVLETPISDSQLFTNIPLLLSPNTGSPFMGSVSVQVVVNGSASNSVLITLLALPANTGAVGATTQAYLTNILQQLNAMQTQTTTTLPSGQTSFNSFLSASIQQVQQLQGQVSTIAAGGQVTAPDGSVMTQSTIDVIDRLLQSSGTPSFSQLPPSALASSRRGAFPLLHALSQTSGTGTVNLSEAALAGADSLCMDADVAKDMSDVLSKETIGVCAASLLGWTAPVTVPVCGFLKLFTPAQIGVEIGNAVCDVAPVNLAIIAPSPATPATTVNGPSITEAPTGVFKSTGNATGQVAETATDAVLNNLQLNKSIFQYILGNKIAASVVNDAIQDAFTKIVGNVIDTSTPNVFNFETNPVPLTMVSLEPSPNGFFSFSGLTMTPGSAAGTTSLYFDTSAFRSLDPSGNVTNVSSLVSRNQMLATIQTLVTVSPSQANVASGGTVQFGASVLGVGPSLAGVTWGVDGITGGNTTVGVISSSGLYTALGSSGTHTITATSVFDGSIGSVTVVVASSSTITGVTVTCSPSSIQTNQTSTCTPTVSGTGSYSPTVTWSVNPSTIGTVSSGGVFTPSSTGTATIIATSTQDTSKSGSASVAVNAASTVTISPSSVTVPVGAVQTFTAVAPSGGGVTWSIQEGAAGGAISSAGIYTAPSTIGTYHVVATNSANAGQSATATVTVVAAVPYSVLYSFPYAFEAAGLIQGMDGNYYGTNEMIAYKITSSGNFTELAALSSSPDAPISSLIQATDGNFYGVDSEGTGSIFQLTPSGVLATLYSFPTPSPDSVTGLFPWAGIIQGTDGNFYGTTYSGGNQACTPYGYGAPAYGPYDYNPTSYTGYGCGTVYRMDNTGGVVVLYSFSGQSDGNYPQSALIQGSDGNFYGTTSGGGAYGYGTVFKITASGGLQTLHSFAGSDGNGPVASLVQGADGNLYGTTAQGGASSDGEVFRLDTSGNNFTVLHSFSGADGSSPVASLVQGSDGNFYGTTWSGGDLTCGTYYWQVGSNYPYIDNSGCGPVFKMDLSGSITVLHTFEEPQTPDGNAPYAGVIFGKDGYLYGTTYYGGSSVYFGTVFRLGLPTAGGSL